jgi:hypothetical protein
MNLTAHANRVHARLPETHGVTDPGNATVNLGVAICNMWQGEGIRYETLFRDETVGVLDAVNGREYVRMLRRAMDLGGFHQVIFICRTPLVWELADRPVPRS